MKHQAIYKIHPEVKTITEDFICKDSEGNVITINDTLVNEEHAKLEVIKSKNTFYLNRDTIMNSIGWIHERIQSQTVLIQGGKTLTAAYTTAQAIEYYDYKQSLRDRPSIITDWTSISYPVVPQHVYDDMTDSIKALCQELQCDPVV